MRACARCAPNVPRSRLGGVDALAVEADRRLTPPSFPAARRDPDRARLRRRRSVRVASAPRSKGARAPLRVWPRVRPRAARALPLSGRSRREPSPTLRGRTFCSASSSSLRFRARRTRTRNGTLRTPFDHRYLFSFVSRRTSFVFIIFSANFLISRTARGALVLNVRPCNRLFRFTVYSRDTRSATALFLSPLTILRRVSKQSWRALRAFRLPEFGPEFYRNEGMQEERS